MLRLARLCLVVTLTAACATTSQRAPVDPVPAHESLQLASTSLSEQRRVNVYLPPSYARCPGDRYPVLYMPDGGIAEDFPHVANTVDRLIKEGAIRPMLVVGIENTNRRRDMTGPTQNPEDLKVTDQPGGSGRFRAFIANELQPLVQSRYRVTDESAVMGESAAGLFIVESVFLQPELFDTYISLDPSLWWNSDQWIREAPERLARWTPPGPVRLFLASAGHASNGMLSNVQPVEALVAELKQHAPASLQWRYQPNPDLRHDNIYRSVKASVLRELFPAHPGTPSPGCAPAN